MAIVVCVACYGWNKPCSPNQTTFLQRHTKDTLKDTTRHFSLCTLPLQKILKKSYEILSRLRLLSAIISLFSYSNSAINTPQQTPIPKLSGEKQHCFLSRYTILSLQASKGSSSSNGSIRCEHFSLIYLYGIFLRKKARRFTSFQRVDINFLGRILDRLTGSTDLCTHTTSQNSAPHFPFFYFS